MFHVITLFFSSLRRPNDAKVSWTSALLTFSCYKNKCKLRMKREWQMRFKHTFFSFSIVKKYSRGGERVRETLINTKTSFSSACLFSPHNPLQFLFTCHDTFFHFWEMLLIFVDSFVCYLSTQYKAATKRFSVTHNQRLTKCDMNYPRPIFGWRKEEENLFSFRHERFLNTGSNAIMYESCELVRNRKILIDLPTLLTITKAWKSLRVWYNISALSRLFNRCSSFIFMTINSRRHWDTQYSGVVSRYIEWTRQCN